MGAPTVSVHIVTYNSASEIEDCLNSVLNQTYPIRRIVVIDNASEDETCSLLQSYKDKVEIGYNSENVGFATAHNQAIRDCGTEYFLTLNPDVVMSPDYISCIIGVMSADFGIGAASGKLVRKSDESQIDSTGLIMSRARQCRDRTQAGNIKSHDPQEIFGVSGAAGVYRLAMAHDISENGEFFDETFFAYKEDVDVAWRSQLFGWKAVYVPRTLARHARGWKAEARGSQSRKLRRHSYMNRYRMMLKNESIWMVLFHFPYLVVYELLALGYVLVKEPFLLGAWKSFLGDVPNLLNKRKMIQRRRLARWRDVYEFFGEK